MTVTNAASEPDETRADETTLAQVNDEAEQASDDTDTGSDEWVDDETVLARMNDNPPDERDERR